MPIIDKRSKGSPVPNNAKGIATSRQIRSREADQRRYGFYLEMRKASKVLNLATATGPMIARYLNENTTWRTRGKKRDPETGEYTGGLWSSPRVSDEFTALGVDRAAIKRWINAARKKADEWKGVSADALIFQLWHEWQWHEATLLYDKGQGLTRFNKDVCLFVPKFVHPNEWVYPRVREPNANARIVPGASPAARLAYLIFEAFTNIPGEADTDEPVEGDLREPTMPFDAAAYLRSVDARMPKEPEPVFIFPDISAAEQAAWEADNGF